MGQTEGLFYNSSSLFPFGSQLLDEIIQTAAVDGSASKPMCQFVCLKHGTALLFKQEKVALTLLCQSV